MKGTPSAPQDGNGPHCDHDEPMVLRTVNGRKVYVCSRFPRNHCGRWCPLDVSLVPLRPIQTTAAPQPAATPAALAACNGSTALQQTETPRAGDVDMAGSPASADGEPMEESSTPTQQLSTPRIPAAPSKSGSSIESRPQQPPTSTARSLAPLFNAFMPAAVRAAQLGARYVTLRRDSKAMARLQQRAVSISPDAPGSGEQQPRKRARTSAAVREQREEQQQAQQQPPQQAQQPHAGQQQGTQPHVRHPLQELTLSPDGVPRRSGPADQNAAAGQQPPSAATSPASAAVGTSWLVSAAQPRPRSITAPEEGVADVGCNPCGPAT